MHTVDIETFFFLEQHYKRITHPSPHKTVMGQQRELGWSIASAVGKQIQVMNRRHKVSL